MRLGRKMPGRRPPLGPQGKKTTGRCLAAPLLSHLLLDRVALDARRERLLERVDERVELSLLLLMAV